MSLLDSLHPKFPLDASGTPSRRPRSPSLNHNVKQHADRRFSRLNSTVTPPREQRLRSSVGAGYRCGVQACQTLKSPKKRFFSGACGCAQARETSFRRILYIDVALSLATAGRKCLSYRPARLLRCAIKARKQRVSRPSGLLKKCSPPAVARFQAAFPEVLFRSLPQAIDLYMFLRGVANRASPAKKAPRDVAPICPYTDQLYPLAAFADH